jgi:5-formyltetrahydrofolate cyclo-ligase
MAACVAVDKKYFRQILTETRRVLPEALAGRLSSLVAERLCASTFYRDRATVVLYAPKDNETDTAEIFTDALKSGRRVLYPRIVPERRELSLVLVSDRAELRPGAYGLLEPTGSEIVPPEDLGRMLICVPGVAFGCAGERLGRGGGYYDRLLAATAPQIVTAGLAYSFQVLDRLPESPGDRRLDFIVTESALHVAGHAPRPDAARTDQGGIPRCLR